MVDVRHSGVFLVSTKKIQKIIQIYRLKLNLCRLNSIGKRQILEKNAADINIFFSLFSMKYGRKNLYGCSHSGTLPMNSVNAQFNV